MKEFPNKAWAVAGQDGVLITFDEQNACALAGDHMPVQTYVPEKALAEAEARGRKYGRETAWRNAHEDISETMNAYRIMALTVMEQQLVLCRGGDFERMAAKICLNTMLDNPAIHDALAESKFTDEFPLLTAMLQSAGDDDTDFVVVCNRFIDKSLCRKCGGTGTYTMMIDRGATFEALDTKCSHDG